MSQSNKRTRSELEAEDGPLENGRKEPEGQVEGLHPLIKLFVYHTMALTSS